jgi:hypothetical protein
MRGILLLLVLINIAAASTEVKDGKGVYLNFDKNPPHSYIESNYGWYDHEVIVKLTAHDSLSGIAAVSYVIDGSMPVVSYTESVEIKLSTQGIHKIEYFSMDNAGNTEQIKISQVKLDLTAPEISVISPGPRVYLHSDIIALDFSSTDKLSGIYFSEGKINRVLVINSQEFDMLSLSPGFHEFEVLALDNAGNYGFSKLNFTVTSNIESLIALNDRAYRNNWITSEITATSLARKLTLARKNIETKQKVKANNIIKSYMNEIVTQTGKTITVEGASILMKEAGYAYISNV